jgi:predicted Zn-dependent peptidase
MFDPTAIRVRRFDNGLTLLTERITSVRSASIGFWVKRGSRDERPNQNGVAHFVEHMLFKGTTERSPRQIALEIDSMGGSIDAFTAHELSGYYAQVLDERLPDAFTLLADLITAPCFDPEELDRERGVILEEIAAAEDDPEDVLFEAFQREFWDGHSLGRPILGTPGTVSGFGRDDLRAWMEDIGAADVVISAAGNLDHEAVADMVGERFADLAAGTPRPERVAPTIKPHVQTIARDLEQVQLYVAGPGPILSDADRYAAHLLNTMLGGGVSSRLFQTIREERGLVYNVYSSIASYSDTGYFWIEAGTRPQTADVVLDLIEVELRRLCDEPLPADELARTKDQVKAGLMLSLEQTFGRMANLARQEVGFGRTFSLDEILTAIDTVAVEEVQACARRLFSGPLSAGCVAGEAAAAAVQRTLDEHPRFG